MATMSTVFAVSNSLELSSKAAFSGSSSSCNVVQGAPMARAGTRGGSIRASSKNSEEARPARREVLAGILAAGAALGVSTQKVLAAGNPVADVQGAVDEAGAGIKRRIDGIFAKNKPYPQRDTQVTGKGAIADAKGRVNNFLQKSQNPLATTIEKGSQETASAFGPNSASNRAGKEFLGKDTTRVDEATGRVNAGVENLRGKAQEAFGDASGVAQDAAGAAKDAAPGVPQAPGSELFKGLANKIEDVKSNLPGQ